MRLINADRLKKKLTDSFSAGCDTENNTDVTEAFHNGLKVALYELDNALTVEAEPVRRGRWEFIKHDINSTDQYKCSACGEQYWVSSYSKFNAPYCMDCGAKMDLED